MCTKNISSRKTPPLGHYSTVSKSYIIRRGMQCSYSWCWGFVLVQCESGNARPIFIHIDYSHHRHKRGSYVCFLCLDWPQSICSVYSPWRLSHTHPWHRPTPSQQWCYHSGHSSSQSDGRMAPYQLLFAGSLLLKYRLVLISLLPGFHGSRPIR